MKSDMTGKTVLPFYQDAGFYLRSGKKQAEEGNLVPALQKMRRAYELQPSDMENVISLAEMLNRMQRFEESIAVLLCAGTPEELPEEGLFGLVSGFLNMEEFIAARYCLMLYLDKFKNGPNADACRDYLALLFNKQELSWQLGLEEGEDAELILHIHVAKALHYSYLDEACLRYLLAVAPSYPDSLMLQVEIALAEYTLNEPVKAEHRIFNILKRDRENVRANCLLAYIRLYSKREKEAKELLSRICLPDESDFEALGSLTAVLLEAGMYERAEESAELLLSGLPFDALCIHQTAYAKYMLGKTDEARELYRSILTMDAHDTVAMYYLSWIEAHPDPKDGAKGFVVSYDVSYGEAMRRFRELSGIFENGAPEDGLGEREGEIRDLLRWGICSPFFSEKRPFFAALSTMPGEETRRLLRRYLLRNDQPDADKHDAFTALRILGDEGPYPVYYHGMWQFKVTSVTLPNDLPASYMRLHEKLESLAEDGLADEETMQLAIRIYDNYLIGLQGGYPRMSRFQRDAMAAAFVLIALKMQNKEAQPQELAKRFSVTVRRLLNAENRISLCLQSENEEEQP